jgi:thiol:disulfide interchange protein DsbD
MDTCSKDSRIYSALSAAGLMLMLLAFTATATAKFSLGGGKPLPVEEAFIASANTSDRSEITVSFDIAEGYYLYRDKTLITAQSNDAELSAPSFPEAIMINDEFFGETHTYRDQVSITVPVAASDELSSLDINVRFQGCADIGICYPPTDTPLTVTLPAPADSSNIAKSATAGTGTLAKLLGDTQGLTPADPLPQSNRLNNSKTGLELFSEELPLLPPEQAFLPTAAVSADNTITVSWFIEPAYYLYRDKLAFSLANEKAAIDNIEYSASVIQSDEFFGDVPVFRDEATATLKTKGVIAGNDTLEVKYQGCADIGVCFPPKAISLPVAFNVASNADNNGSAVAGSGVVASTAAATSSNVDSDNSSANQAPKTEQDRIRAKLSTSSLWINAASFFVLGLLLSFTPCVFPMIPILSSLILGQGKSISTGKAFGLSLTYVLAMAITYTLVGVFIGLSGYNLQAMFQNPWILSVFALIFILLSLSMFGFYEIQLPQGMQNKLNNWSNKQEGGSWIGVAIMGVLSALIVGPCVTAPLVGALIYIAETGDATVGGVALFSMSMGMGLPLLIIGTSAGKLMPKVGPWMDITKVIFGLTMLAMAIWMLSRFLPGSATVILSALLAICGGIYLGSTSRFGTTISWLSQSIGLILTLYGVALMLGMLSGNVSLTKPLATLNSGGGGVSQTHELEFERVKSEADLATVLDEATSQNQYVMFDYYADWCVSCKEMEAYTFTDATVQSNLAKVRLIQADVTKNDAEDQALLKRFGIFGPPAILFFEPGGNELSDARVVGYMKAEAFNNHLDLVLK